MQPVPSVKWPGREANHSLRSSAEVKHDGAIPPFLRMPSWNGTLLLISQEITSTFLLFKDAL
jgi:hypothetical protein